MLLMMFGSESWREWFLCSSSKDLIQSGQESFQTALHLEQHSADCINNPYSGISVPHANPCTQSGLSDQQDMAVIVTLCYAVEYRSIG